MSQQLLAQAGTINGSTRVVWPAAASAGVVPGALFTFVEAAGEVTQPVGRVAGNVDAHGFDLETPWAGSSRTAAAVVELDFDPQTGVVQLSDGMVAGAKFLNRNHQLLNAQTLAAVVANENVVAAQAARAGAEAARDDSLAAAGTAAVDAAAAVQALLDGQVQAAEAARSGAESARDLSQGHRVAAEEAAADAAADRLLAQQAAGTATAQAVVATQQANNAAGSASGASNTLAQVQALRDQTQSLTSTAQGAAATAVALNGFSNLQGVLGAIATLSNIVDVAWYDTSRDSDGGAWRLRGEQSYKNEPLGTATRGSRREFPAQAIIVATTNQVIIYDADQSTPTMWMVFNAVNGGFIISGGNVISSVAMRDGLLCVGLSSSVPGLYVLNFLTERGEHFDQFTGQNWPYLGPIANRNTSGWVLSQNGGRALINGVINDIAITVLPGSPLDPATGLPRPTIAVGTEGGVSVVLPDGRVANGSWAQPVSRIAFADDGVLWLTYRPNMVSASGLVVTVTPPQYQVNGFNSQNPPLNPQISAGTIPALMRPGIATYQPLAPIPGGMAVANPPVAAGSEHGGLTLMQYTASHLAGSMVAYITASANTIYGGGAFNTGWLAGDTRLALASTSTASVTGATVLSDSFDYADTAAMLAAGWLDASTAPATIAGGGGVMTLTRTGGANARADRSFTTVAGQAYVVTHSMASGRVSVGTTVGAGDIVNDALASTGFVQFRATGTTTWIRFRTELDGAVTLDNLLIRIAVPDRSMRGNGLIVNGTVTQTAVAAGAELTAFGGFSASNFLEMLYRSDFDFGTGDFFVYGWALFGGGGDGVLFERASVSGGAYANAPALRLWIASAGQLAMSVTQDGFGVTHSAVATGNFTNAPGYRFVWGGRRAGQLFLGIDDRLVSTTANTTNLTNAAAVLRVGLSCIGTLPSTNHRFALPRISATAPTPEQIRRMFEDERHLFQANALCTLGGAVAGVAAVSFDQDTRVLSLHKSDGTSRFVGLRRIEHVTGVGTSNDHRTGAAAGGGYVIGTATQAVGSNPALTLRERLTSPRDRRPRIDQNRLSYPGVTTDATPTVIGRVPVAEGETVQLQVLFTAVEWGANPTERGGYERRLTVYRPVGGNVVLQGSVQTIGTDNETTASMDVTAAVNTTTQTVDLSVTGVASKRLVWRATALVNRITDLTYEVQ